MSSTVVRNSAPSAVVRSQHSFGCTCPSCTGVHTPGCTCSTCASRSHSASCLCAACRGSATQLFMSEAAVETEEETADVPAEVEALDGIESDEEAHNAERPARSALKKKQKPKGKALSEFSVGDSVKAKVKTITNYGAFLDIGASTDGLLHISNLSAGFVNDVNEVLTVGQEVDVRISSIDEKKGQVALTLLTEEEEAAASQPRQSRPKREDRGGGRRDDSKVVKALAEKGFDSAQFVDGTVVSTVDFGAFVRFDASQLNSEVEGEMDGLVHISALSVGRADSVTSIVKEGDKVQIRCKSIEGRKVSLTMVSVEDEEKIAEQRQASREPVVEGAKDWKESLEKMRGDMPTFKNAPLVVDLRK